MVTFKNFGEFVDKVNGALGAFCDEFGSKRKALAGLRRLPKRGVLFVYDKVKQNPWAINQGGGTEVQYHTVFDVNTLELRYGLGFNTQYVPFSANKISMVEIVRPFINSFLKNEVEIKQLLPDYDIVYGNREQLIHPKNDQYTLFGKRVKVGQREDGYFLNDEMFDLIINDLKRQFKPYQIVFSDKNKLKTVAMDIQSYIDILRFKGQIILQGPPGTGKTFTAKDIAEQMLFSSVSANKKDQKQLLENSEQFKLIQFHPAYSYEDFVRGIVAESNGTLIEYKTVNKVFAVFVNKALDNYTDSQKDIKQLTEENWINENFTQFVDHINDEIERNNGRLLLEGTTTYLKQVESEYFRYSGDNWNNTVGNRMYFKDIVEMFRQNIKERQQIKRMSGVSGLAIQHASYFMKVLDLFYNFMEDKQQPNTKANQVVKKDFILIIDEINRANLPAVLGELIYALEYRGEEAPVMYSIGEDSTLVIPPNLFIIGTMNTADRSIGHIDYAIRRRFAFIDILPKALDGGAFELDLFKKVSALFIQNIDDYITNNSVPLQISEYLSEEFRPEDVWLGHSYFINQGGNFQLRKQYEIIPILKEYVKDGILKPNAEQYINAL